ncbi:MAG: selenocysteine-specific translation elongation factor, partial [Actinobacteria bacterium]|nr:selenocysteine-specific translation elongation factor [Actinomycetota bacterium]
MPGELRVVATAGHVDHGKSSLIVRLTGIDPDRWEEEKRRGLTIDLGYAWCTLPSGREVGFVDVPGHERFLRNMLAGVGPVRLVLLIVAADEGWKPQTEEHVQILDVLGVAGGVVALTKRDLVDEETLARRTEEVRERLSGTALAGSPIVALSSHTGEGIEEVRAALDSMLASAPPSEDARTRLFVDRVFTIRGAGTVVTGTLTGGCLDVGDEVALLPSGARARIRSLQTHKKDQERACPVSRVAANLVGAEREELERGEVLGLPGAWRATTVFEAQLRPVRELAHPITERGAYKLYAGAAETDARLHLYGAAALGPHGFVRIRVSRPMVLDVFDRFVLREAGRRETVAGGIVLDVAPPKRPGADAHLRLTARAEAQRDALPRLLATERGAVRAAEAELLTGSGAHGAARAGGWLVREDLLGAVERSVSGRLEDFHRAHPLEEGAELALAREGAAAALRAAA